MNKQGSSEKSGGYAEVANNVIKQSTNSFFEDIHFEAALKIIHSKVTKAICNLDTPWADPPHVSLEVLNDEDKNVFYRFNILWKGRQEYSASFRKSSLGSNIIDSDTYNFEKSAEAYVDDLIKTGGKD